MTGTMKIYFEGHGWILGDDGNDYYVYYKDLIQKEKYYRKAGKKVTFDVEDRGGEHLNAVNIDVEVPEPTVYPRCGFGEWVHTSVKNRRRCTDCGITTQMAKNRPLPYCPHCGAVMGENLANRNNQVNINLAKNDEVPPGRWTIAEDKYRCNNCKKVSDYPAKFCPNCGRYMKKIGMVYLKNGMRFESSDLKEKLMQNA